MVDLLEERALYWRDGSDEPVEEPVPADMRDQVAAAREELLDAICETDEGLLERRLEGEDIDLPTLKAALRRATIGSDLVPVFCGASRNRIAVQPLLDGIIDYLPAPVDMPPVLGMVPCRPGDCEEGEETVLERPDDPAAPLCASAFKIVSDPHVGHLTWVRVFSGQLSVRDSVYNPRADTPGAGRAYLSHARRGTRAGRPSGGRGRGRVGGRQIGHHRRHALRSRPILSRWNLSSSPTR